MASPFEQRAAGLALALCAALTSSCTPTLDSSTELTDADPVDTGFLDAASPDATPRDAPTPDRADAVSWHDAYVPTDLPTTMDSGLPGDTGGPPRDTGVAMYYDGPPPDARLYPAFLRVERTYDQERDYMAWEGPVEHISLRHRDNTSLPASEGGTSCSGTCTEDVTRIGAGGRVWGRFTYVQTFSAQVASVSADGVGEAVIEACGSTVGRITLRGGGSVAGFTNQPQPSYNVPTAGDCTWSVRAVGGYVDFRAVTVQFRGGAPPTVDVRVDGTNGPLSAGAPASYLISWTSTSASSCEASGDWAGARAISGSTMYRGVGIGTYTYRVTCTNGAGSATDAVEVRVNQGPG